MSIQSWWREVQGNTVQLGTVKIKVININPTQRCDICHENSSKYRSVKHGDVSSSKDSNVSLSGWNISQKSQV